jgi:hypothetical protein
MKGDLTRAYPIGERVARGRRTRNLTMEGCATEDCCVRGYSHDKLSRETQLAHHIDPLGYSREGCLEINVFSN